MIPLYEQQQNAISSKLENYLVKTNDNKFNDVKQILGDDYEDRKAYLITNYPLGDSQYIQGGGTHTVLGMEYDSQKYGYQVSYGIDKILYRKKRNNVWSEWTNIGEEVGSNSKGTYIKYPNGTMICRSSFSIEANSSEKSFDFPLSFKDTSYNVIISNIYANSKKIIFSTTNPDKSYFTVYPVQLENGGTPTVLVQGNYIAIGTWK